MSDRPKTKKEWKAVAIARGKMLDERDRLGALSESPTFDTLEICWSTRTLHWRGRRIDLPPDSDCLVIPVTGGKTIWLRDWSPHY